MQDSLLRVKDLTHAFMEGEAEVRALRGVSLEAQRGKVTAIVGPSGCGKSTLLYLLGLLDRPDSGEIFLDNRPMVKAGDEERTAFATIHRVRLPVPLSDQGTDRP